MPLSCLAQDRATALWPSTSYTRVDASVSSTPPAVVACLDTSADTTGCSGEQAVAFGWVPRKDVTQAGVSESVTAKAYRLLRAIMNTAVDEDEDKLLPRNPCSVKGADRESPHERPVLTIAQVFTVADEMPERFRAMVLLAALCSLRFGEVTALRRCDLADDSSTVRIARAFVEVPGQGFVAGPPKSRAGVRTVTVPKSVRAELLAHLKTYVGPEPTALLFTGEKSGNAVRRPSFAQRTKWTATVARLGLKGLHFHDLRHAGNIWASKAGMSTKDLMARMGHDDMRAALIYQRATSDADERIADSLSKLVTEHRRKGKKAARRPSRTGRKKRRDDDDDGAAGVLVPAS